MSRWFAVCILVSALAASEPGDPRISASIPWMNGNGYVPVVITVESPLDRKITFTCTHDENSASTSIAMTAGERRRFTLLLPTNGSGYGSGQLTWRTSDGRSASEPVASARSGTNPFLYLVGSETALPKEPWQDFADGMSLSSSPFGSSKEPLARFEPADLPDRWQGCPTQTTIVLAGAADHDLTTAQREALLTWSTAGGLLVITDGSVAQAWRQHGANVQLISTPGSNDAFADAVRAHSSDANNPGTGLDLPNTDRVPVTGFMVVALLFALIVGPINLYWVRKRNARHLFLFTTPILSLATCVILLLTDIALHGLSLRRGVQQLVILDQSTNQAVAWTFGTYFSAFSVSSLDLDPEVEAVRLTPEGNNWRHYRKRNSAYRYSLEWGDRQAATGTWGTARMNSTIRYRHVSPARQRLDITAAGEQLVVVNGLGTTISELTVHAPDGRSWYLDTLAQGESGSLAAVDAQVFREELTSTRTPFGSAAIRCVTELNTGWWYEARTAAPMLAIPGPTGIDAVPPTGLVVGRLAALSTTTTGARP